MCTTQEVNEIVEQTLKEHEKNEDKLVTEIVGREITKAFWKVLAWGGVPIIISLLSIGALYVQVERNTRQLDDDDDRFTQSEGDAEREARMSADKDLQRQIDSNQASVIKILDDMKIDIRYIRDKLGG